MPRGCFWRKPDLTQCGAEIAEAMRKAGIDPGKVCLIKLMGIAPRKGGFDALIRAYSEEPREGTSDHFAGAFEAMVPPKGEWGKWRPGLAIAYPPEKPTREDRRHARDMDRWVRRANRAQRKLWKDSERRERRKRRR